MATAVLKKINSPFMPIPKENLGPQCPDHIWETKRSEWNLIPKAEKVVDADGVQQDIIVYVPTHIKDVDIQEYINSFRDDVGIQNILRKVALTGDRSYLNQTGRVGEKPEGGLEEVKDYTNVPKNKTEAFNAVVAGVNAYDQLPEEIKQKMSFEQFAQEFGEAQINAYVNSLVEKYNASKEEGGKE